MGILPKKIKYKCKECGKIFEIELKRHQQNFTYLALKFTNLFKRNQCPKCGSMKTTVY